MLICLYKLAASLYIFLECGKQLIADRKSEDNMVKITLGTTQEAAQRNCIQVLIVEFIVTFLFVFAGVASKMAVGMYII